MVSCWRRRYQAADNGVLYVDRAGASIRQIARGGRLIDGEPSKCTRLDDSRERAKARDVDGGYVVVARALGWPGPGRGEEAFQV